MYSVLQGGGLAREAAEGAQGSRSVGSGFGGWFGRTSAAVVVLLFLAMEAKAETELARPDQVTTYSAGSGVDNGTTAGRFRTWLPVAWEDAPTATGPRQGIALTAATSATPVLAIYSVSHSWPARSAPVRLPERRGLPVRVVAAVWQDGRVVWSDDAFAGGSPYFQGRVAPGQLATVFKQLGELGCFAPGTEEQGVLLIPDATHVSMVGWGEPGQRMVWSSCHELFEQNTRLEVGPNGVRVRRDATSGAVEPNLSGAQATPTPEESAYYHKRKKWGEIKRIILSLVPQDPAEITAAPPDLEFLTMLVQSR